MLQGIQKRSVLAILTMIESGLREIRALVADENTAEGSSPELSRPDVVPYRHDGALSDQEEQSLEEMMEQSRLDLLKRSQGVLDKFYDDGPGFDKDLELSADYSIGPYP